MGNAKLGSSGVGSGGGGGSTQTIRVYEAGTILEINPIADDGGADTPASYTIAHGLGQKPDHVEIHLECVVTDRGYAVGDRVAYPTSNRLLVWYDATSVGVSTEARLPYIVHKNGSAEGEIGENDWKMVVTPLKAVSKTVAGSGGGGGGSAAGHTFLDDTDPLPTPTAANEGSVYVRRRTGTIYAQRHTVTHVTAPVAAYDDYPLVATGTGVRGVGRLYPATGIEDGSFWFLINYDRWDRYDGSAWQHSNGTAALGADVWQGAWVSEAEATSHVDAINDVVYVGDHQAGVLRRVTAFTAGISPSDVREWVPAGQVGAATGGLTQDEVDIRVQTLVHDEAEESNSDAWPIDKGGTGQTTAAAALAALGGGVGVVTALAPLSGIHEYEEADEHKVVNQDGTLYEIIKRPEATQAATYYELTDPLFRGFETRVNQVLSPADQEFVFILGTGAHYSGFEKWEATAATWLANYNPFAAGEPWENAPAAATYAGAITYRGAIYRRADATAAADETGEAYVIRQERVVLLVDTFTAATDEQFIPRSVVPHSYGNPRAYFWIYGQTVRIPQDTVFPYVPGEENTVVNNLGLRVRLRFASTTPNEGFDGGLDLYQDIFVATADVSGDIDVGTGGTEGVVFNLPAGRHDVSLLVESNDGDAYWTNTLNQIATGTDDAAVAGGWQGFAGSIAADGVQSGIQMRAPDVISDGSEQLYLRLNSYLTADTSGFRGFMMIEFRGDA